MAQAKKATKTKKPVEKTKEEQLKHAEVVAEAVPTEGAPEAKLEVKEDTVAAKAGKRSPKALRDAEARQVKQDRKIAAVVSEPSDKSPAKPSRSKAERAGKKYREAFKLIDKTKSYSLAEALDLAIKTSTAKFDASVEMHINLGVDPRQADQNVRDTVVLPAGTGKKIRIAVLAEADDATKAKAAGADIAGLEDIISMLDKEEINFDVLISTPALMQRLGKYAKLLGPRGLMPNPKSGTVSQNPEAAVTEAKAGRVEYRVDQSGIVHLAIGKVSFGPEKLRQNAEAVLNSVRSAKPASLKGLYIKSVYLSTTMGPSIKLDLS